MDANNTGSGKSSGDTDLTIVFGLIAVVLLVGSLGSAMV